MESLQYSFSKKSDTFILVFLSPCPLRGTSSSFNVTCFLVLCLDSFQASPSSLTQTSRSRGPGLYLSLAGPACSHSPLYRQCRPGVAPLRGDGPRTLAVPLVGASSPMCKGDSATGNSAQGVRVLSSQSVCPTGPEGHYMHIGYLNNILVRKNNMSVVCKAACHTPPHGKRTHGHSDDVHNTMTG